MAKKEKKNKKSNADKKENKALSTAITIVIILIWLGIFGILIKLDVGGFGSKILAPVIKDIPVINRILPDSARKNSASDNAEDYPYKSMADAINYIKELEVQLSGEQEKNTTLTNKNDDLQKEIDRLKKFEENQDEFEALKSKFYDEVVFGEDAIDYENYIEYYKSINPEKAEELYQEALEKYAYNKAYTEQADAYAAMEPKAAAAIFLEMSGDLDIVVNILQCMKTAKRAAVIAAISDKDANYAAKITKLIAPE